MTPEQARIDTGSGDGAAPASAARVEPVRPDLEDGPATKRSRWGRRIGIGLLSLVGLIALVLIGGWLYLQSNAGRERIRGVVVGQIQNLLAENAEVTIESLSGSFLSDAVMTGLEVTRNGETVVAVDTLLIDYNLTTLLDRTFSASRLALFGPRVFVRQRADSTFNVAGLLLPQEDTGKEPFAVILDRVVVRNGAADIVWYRSDGRDSVHAVRNLGALIEDFRTEGDSLNGDIASLETRLLAPFDRGAIDLEGGGRFSKSELVLRDLIVTSDAGTDIAGRARLQFTTDGTLPVFEASLAAAPLALEDARAFAGVALYGDPRLRLRADSDGDLLTATLTGALEDATVNLDGEFSAAPNGGPVRYRAEGTLRRFNPAALTRNPALEADVTGDLRLNLQGTTLEQLSGPFRVSLRETRVGQRQIDRLQLDGSFAAGRVSFDLEGALPGASLSAEGMARPFDTTPTVQVAGTAENVDLGVLLPGSGPDGHVRG